LKNDEVVDFLTSSSTDFSAAPGTIATGCQHSVENILTAPFGGLGSNLSLAKRRGNYKVVQSLTN